MQMKYEEGYIKVQYNKLLKAIGGRRTRRTDMTDEQC